MSISMHVVEWVILGAGIWAAALPPAAAATRHDLPTRETQIERMFGLERGKDGVWRVRAPGIARPDGT